MKKSNNNTTRDFPELMTLREVAKALRVSYATARSMVSGGKLPSIRVSSAWRVRRSTIESILNPKEAA